MDRYKVHQLIKFNGNPIFAGIYDAVELPDRIKENKNLCTKLDENAPKTANYQAGTVTQNVTVGTKSGITGVESFDPKPAVDIDQNTQPVETAKSVTSINPNTASLDELADLDGITVTTAQKVIEERSKEKFVDLDDLDKRVPLKGSRKWSKFSDRLKFNTED